jgi:hypothetical protein
MQQNTPLTPWQPISEHETHGSRVGFYPLDP